MSYPDFYPDYTNGILRIISQTVLIRQRAYLVTAAVFPSIFPSFVNPATVKWRLAKTNVHRVMQTTHPLGQRMLRTCVWWTLVQPVHNKTLN